jgi:hypothetical protein
VRHIAVSLSGLLAAVFGIFAAPSAFAMRIAPIGSGASSSVAVTPAVHHGGLGLWPVSLVVVAAVVVLVLGVVRVLGRESRRSAPHPAR